MAKDKDRVALSTCVGKLMAYLRVGRTEDAKRWAKALVKQLEQMGLYETT